MPSKKVDRNHISVVLLRAGLAFVFLYAAFSSLQDPAEWSGYLPTFLTTHYSADGLLKMFAIYELALGIWLITGYLIRWAAILTAVTLIGIVLSTPHDLIVTFRDVGLAFAALSLAFMDR